MHPQVQLPPRPSTLKPLAIGALLAGVLAAALWVLTRPAEPPSTAGGEQARAGSAEGGARPLSGSQVSALTSRVDAALPALTSAGAQSASGSADPKNVPQAGQGAGQGAGQLDAPTEVEAGAKAGAKAGAEAGAEASAEAGAGEGAPTLTVGRIEIESPQAGASSSPESSSSPSQPAERPPAERTERRPKRPARPAKPPKMTLSVYPVRPEHDVGGKARVSWDLQNAPSGAKDLTVQVPGFIDWRGPSRLPAKGTAEISFARKGSGSLKVCYQLKRDTFCDSQRLTADVLFR